MITALGLLLVLTVAAAEPKGMVTLACSGQKMSRTLPNRDVSEEQVSIGAIADITARRVVFGDAWPSPISIQDVTEKTIMFWEGRSADAKMVYGSIERISGETQARIKNDDLMALYSLKCKRAQRMF
jgi:hypothetical protein